MAFKMANSRERHTFVSLVVLLCSCITAGCADTKVIQWEEDTKLSDGRVVVVKRSNEYQRIGSPQAGFRVDWVYMNGTLSVQEPSPIGQRVAWTGSLIPIAIDVIDGQLYLVGVAGGRAIQHYNLPNKQDHVALYFHSGDWFRFPLDDLPLAIRPNLFSGDRTYLFEDGQSSHMSLELKTRLDSNPEIGKPFKEIPRSPK